MRLLIGPILLLLAFDTPAARGAGFDLSLEVSDGRGHQSAATQPSTQPLKPSNPLERRRTFSGEAVGQFAASWTVTRSAKAEAKDILVHFFVVRLDHAGQAAPDLTLDRVPIESALTMDFPPGEKSAGMLKFRVDRAGVYLVRVEVRGESDEPGREDFAAMELVAK